jgi:5-formyltetrahydrofolate cyclo-ligase
MNISSKVELRQQLLQWRIALPEAEVRRRSQLIIQHLKMAIPWQQVRSLHCYMPIARDNEINTADLLQYVWQQWPDLQTAVPVMRRGQLHSVLVNSTTEWHEGSLHVPEPVAGKELSSHYKFDLIVVPMLGYNKQGYRIGYGGGHYDRFLANQPQAQAVSLCYQEGLVMFQPEPHDVPLRQIVNEQGLQWLG